MRYSGLSPSHIWDCQFATSQPARTPVTSTCAAPGRSSARDAALAVAPEVSTSSTSTIRRPLTRGVPADAKGALHVLRRAARASGRPGCASPSRARADPGSQGLPARARDLARERGGLIEAAHPEPARVQRHRRDDVGLGEQVGARARHPGAHRAREFAAIGIFQPMHQTPRRAVLETRDRAGALKHRGIVDRLRATAAASPRSCSNGVPSRSQNGRSMKRIPRQHAGQSPSASRIAARQARQVGG